MSGIIGIDLGTSTSEAAIFIEGTPQLILNLDGEAIMPSVVGIDEDDGFLVGKKAEERYLLYPEKTVIEVKRKMGSGETVRLGEKELTPVEISSKILKTLKESAEAYLGETVNRAVITVPAYFNNLQRQETMEAGKMAGLRVERIINEPTAAALCYGIDHMEEESHILVYDFGGGTFDVTLLEMFGGVLEVKASSGDNQLGGKDFDEAIIEYLLERCQETYRVDLRKDLYAMVKLKEEAVRCKIALSEQDSYEVLIPMISQKAGNPISIQETITVELLEQLIRHLVERTKEPVQVVLQDGGIRASDLDIILLVGGSTKVPYVKRYVEELLGRKPEELVNPDLAVVMGACIQGGMLSEEIDSDTGIMLTDVAPYPLGVRIAVHKGLFMDDNCLDVLIPRNVTIPTTKRKRYGTCLDNQRSSNIEIYQGEKSRATSNFFLGKFILSGIPPRKAGAEKIDVEFSYDLNGVLDVRASIVSTGMEAAITIETAGMKEVDTTGWKEAPLAKKFRSTIRKAEKLVLSGALMEEETQEDLECLIENLKIALIQEKDQEELEGLEEDLMDFLDVFLEDFSD